MHLFSLLVQSQILDWSCVLLGRKRDIDWSARARERAQNLETFSLGYAQERRSCTSGTQIYKKKKKRRDRGQCLLLYTRSPRQLLYGRAKRRRAYEKNKTNNHTHVKIRKRQTQIMWRWRDYVDHVGARAWHRLEKMSRTWRPTNSSVHYTQDGWLPLYIHHI